VQREGAITLKQKKRSKNGRHYTLLRLHDMDTGVFDWKDLSEGFKPGDVVRIDYTEGQYPRLQKIEPVTTPIVEEKIEGVAEYKRARAINRAVALKADVDFANEVNGGKQNTITPDKVLELAEEWSKWLEQ